MPRHFEAGNPDGYPLILLHGWGASKEIWRHVVRPPLTSRYRIVALDFPGTGEVEIAGDLSPVSIADWLASETERLRISRFAVLGHSMGGNVATHLAVRHPERVQALALVSAALYSHRLIHANWYLHPATGPITLGGARLLAGMAGRLEGRLAPVESPGWARGYMRRSGYLAANNSMRGLQMQLRGLLRSPVSLEQIAPDLPILIVHGAKDSTIPAAWSVEAAAARPSHTELIIYPDALHCPMDTHTSRFVHDVTHFLDNCRK